MPMESATDSVRVSILGFDTDVTEISAAPRPSPEALEQARRLAPGQDIYALEADWQRYWISTGQPVLRSPDKAFLGYVAVRMSGQKKTEKGRGKR